MCGIIHSSDILTMRQIVLRLHLHLVGGLGGSGGRDGGDGRIGWVVAGLTLRGSCRGSGHGGRRPQDLDATHRA